MRTKRVLGVLFIGSVLFSTVRAEAQLGGTLGPSRGGPPMVCTECKPVTPTVFQEPKNKETNAVSESQTTSLFSPWFLHNTRVAPALQTAQPFPLLTYFAGSGPAEIAHVSPTFVSPGTIFVTWEAITDLYASADGQQTGIYFAYYIKEDTNNNGVFDCPGSDNCGYLVQHTSGPYFGITAMAYTAANVNSTLVLNSSVPLSQTFSIQTTPGLRYSVELHLWGAHFIKNVQRLLYIVSNRLMITRGPNS